MQSRIFFWLRIIVIEPARPAVAPYQPGRMPGKFAKENF
jgi:hypothetical protein